LLEDVGDPVLEPGKVVASPCGDTLQAPDREEVVIQRSPIVMTTFPVFCSVSTYLAASTTSSSG